MTAPAPRVRLPSQASINPNLTTLISLCERLIEHHGPATAGALCGALAVQLREAAEHPSVAGYVAGPIVVGPDCLIEAADWFAKAAAACARCRN